jgi:hypothetical protein
MSATRKSLFERLIDERDPASTLRFCVLVVTLTCCLSIIWATVCRFDSTAYWVNIGVILVGALAVKMGQKAVEARISATAIPTANPGTATPPTTASR